MNNSKVQIMTCGACAVSMDASGQTTTSIDALVNGAKTLVNRLGRRDSSRRTAVSARL